MATETPNFSIAINVAGAKPYNAGGTNVEPKTGLYAVTVSDASLYETEKGQSIKFVAKIVDGEFAGREEWIFVGLDTDKPGIQRSWATAFLSLGFTQQQIDAGITINPSLLKGKKGFMSYKNSNETDSKKANREFATPVAYKAWLASQGVSEAQDIGTGANIPAVSNVTVPTPSGAAARLRGMAGK